MRIIVEDNVVIDDSDIEFSGPPGEYVIPFGTVVAHSRYRGRPVAGGSGAFWYKVDITNGEVVPFEADTVHSTIQLANGQRLTGSLPMDFNPKEMDLETGRLNLDRPIVEFDGMSLAELRAQALFQRDRPGGQQALPLHTDIVLPDSNGDVFSSNLFSDKQTPGVSQDAELSKYTKKLTWLAWTIFIMAAAAFIYFMVQYFFIPQLTYQGMDGVVGTDFVVYYLGPLWNSHS